MKQTGAWNRVSSYQTKINTYQGGGNVRYHKTDIVNWDDEHVILDTGHFQTVTTKRKMNQASNQFGLGVSVFQKNRLWYVSTKAGTFDWPSAQSIKVIERSTGKVL
jgi:hypothetical protein